MRLFSIVFLLFLLPSLSFAACANRVESIQSVGDIKAAFRCLNDEIRVLKREFKKVGKGKTVVVNSIHNLPTPTISKTETHNNIKYDLLGCSNKRGNVECNFQVTLLDGEKTLRIYNSTKIFDENGELHKVNYIQIGNASSNYRDKITLISNFPVKLILRFSGIPPQSTRIVVLKIEILYYSIEFHNIALQ